jgi:hypothetical protein
MLVVSLDAYAEECVLSEGGLTSRPERAGGPTEVTIRMYVNDIVAIDDANQSFTADVMFRADWQDPRLAHPEPEPCRAAPGQIWTPELQLLNLRIVQRLREPELIVSPDGAATYLLRSFGDFSFHARLSDFPFDEQELGFYIVSTLGNDEVHLQTGSDLVDIESELSVPNWQITIDGIRQHVQYIAPVDRYMPRMDIVLRAKRDSGYYTWQQILPMILVIMMTWIVFWIPCEFVPPRVGLAATAVLTLIAYRFAMSSVLPPIAYLTRMDLFVVGASVLVFLGLTATVAVSYIFENHDEKLGYSVNRAARWLLPSMLFVVATIAFYA